MGMTVPFSTFLYPAFARTGPLTDSGLPTGLIRSDPKQMRITGLHGADLPVRIFSSL
jgi:hypothetical protein